MKPKKHSPERINDLEVNFAERLTRERRRRRRRMLGAVNTAKRLIPNNFGTLLGFSTESDLMRPMNLVIRKNPILKNKPPGSPPFPVINPLIQNPTNPIPNYIVDLHLPLIHRRLQLCVVAVGTRHRSLRRHRRLGRHWREVPARSRALIRVWRHAAERMHVNGRLNWNFQIQLIIITE